MQVNFEHTSNLVTIDGEDFYGIDNLDSMAEFFMTLVSSGDHWFFISSFGALSAGRNSPEQALFPYGTVDKIYDSRGIQGPVCSIAIQDGSVRRIWEPFARWTNLVWQVRRRLYRNVLGSRIIFEEENLDLGLTHRASWSSAHRFGFIRKTTLLNTGKAKVELSFTDGLLNIMHAGVTRQLHDEFSCLTDAYKDSSFDTSSSLAAYGLSSIQTDKAQPMEALQASTVWYHGPQGFRFSLNSESLEQFRAGGDFVAQHRNRGNRGQFLVHGKIALEPKQEESWYLVADLAKDHGDLSSLIHEIRQTGDDMGRVLDAASAEINQELLAMTNRADGLSKGRLTMHDWHHRSNVLYNIMRGGIPSRAYEVETADFLSFVAIHNPAVQDQARQLLAPLDSLSIQDLLQRVKGADPRLASLASIYLPLTFSRRHGDPSRPWNRFAIKVRDKKGLPILNHQGNWRDIFQNWEALGWSHPHFLPGFVSNFLSAMTLDGFNPYRIGRDGIDWEKVEPDDPWSNIGYWNDHQVVYFQRLAELSEAFFPGSLGKGLEEKRYTSALVPYTIASWSAMSQNPRATIDFNHELDGRIEKRVAAMGADGRLVLDEEGKVHHGSLVEKIMVLALAKVGSLVPAGGIWMNTQRPEWNDANNALVGNGLSVVTTAHLRRFLAFWRKLLADSGLGSFSLPQELFELLQAQTRLLSSKGMAALDHDGERFAFVESMTLAMDRWHGILYKTERPGTPVAASMENVLAWFDAALPLIDQTLGRSRRRDGLFESYNIMVMDLDARTLCVRHLTLMLEGQVAILSAGYLSNTENLDLMEALYKSELYREDQHSFLLYPWKELPDYFAKNRVEPARIAENPTLGTILARQDRTVLYTDDDGVVRFGAGFKNHDDIDRIMATWTADERMAIHELYESVFHHREFMGRSGTMYAYEGLGSIYWHMVAKLLLAAMETRQRVELEDPALLERADRIYLEIRRGIGYQKPASVYGAFPWEPYSHTPRGKGAQQPGMTGQVKEEVITRFGEYGIQVEKGCIVVRSNCVLDGEYLEKEASLMPNIVLPVGAVGFTFCQVPFIRHRPGAGTGKVSLEVFWADGRRELSGAVLSPELSAEVFARTGRIARIEITTGVRAS